MIILLQDNKSSVLFSFGRSKNNNKITVLSLFALQLAGGVDHVFFANDKFLQKRL
jgi:hypothetical protein